MATSKLHTPLFIKKSYVYNYSVSASQTVVITASQLDMSYPAGFDYAVVCNATTGNNNVLIRGMYADGGHGGQANGFVLRNVTTTSQTGNAQIEVLYIKV